MTNAELKSLMILAKLESQGYFKNSLEFAEKKFQEHAKKVHELSDIVYQSYLAQGVSIAEERKQIYISNNLKKVSDFI